MEIVRGMGISDDTIFGKCIFLRRKNTEDFSATAGTVREELKKIKEAIELTSSQLRDIYSRSISSIGAENAMILKAQELILNDQEFTSKIEENIKNLDCSAEYALEKTGEYFSNLLGKTNNEYINARADDVKEVCFSLARNIGKKSGGGKLDYTRIEDEHDSTIIVAVTKIFVSDVLELKDFGVSGIVAKGGCTTSHAAILAHSLGMVAVVGTGCDFISCDGKKVILSGKEGLVIVSPDEETTKVYLEKKRLLNKEKEDLKSTIGEKNLTKDGHEVKIMANIYSVQDMECVSKNDAQGIGLFRSEYIYIGRQERPSEDDQFEIYKRLLLQNRGKQVIIRTLDIGFDKLPVYFENLFYNDYMLGDRGIRFCLRHLDIFEEQLRALLRASVYGELSIMLPMVTLVSEVLQTKEIIKELEEQLDAKGILYGRGLKLGVMIETPAAVMIASELAGCVDFFSVGTNDLTQFTFAIDRNSKEIQRFLLSSDVILRMIDRVAKAARLHNIPFGVCGVCAGDIRFLGELVGLGVNSLSVDFRQVLKIRRALKNMLFSEQECKVRERIGNNC